MSAASADAVGADRSPTLLERRLAWPKLVRTRTATPTHHVEVLASFTAQPIAPYLGTALHGEGIDADVAIGAYDQIEQGLLLSPSSGPAPVVVVWLRVEDALGSQSPLVEGDAAAALDRFALLGSLIADRAATGTTVVAVLPAVPDVVPLGVGDAANVHGVAAVAARLRELLRASLTGCSGVLVVDADDAVRELGRAHAIDHRRMAGASVPYTDAAFAFVADRAARLLRVSLRGSAKVAVVDADNTLWGGVVGEDGADGIDLADNGPGAAYRSFQRYLLDLRRAGLLVALASKNNEEDAWEGFERGEMVLRREHLAAWRVGWRPKSTSLAEMADELNVGVASMVMIDDSGAELAEIGVALPDVRTVRMPSDPTGWPDSVARSGVFDRLNPTASDLARAGSYAVETQRRSVRATVSPEAYLASLDLAVGVFTPGSGDLPRLAQLVAKTNQFTLGGHRHGEAELAALLSTPSVWVRLVSAVDAFGDYGVIGAMVVRDFDQSATLDTFVLSCRAMGRGVEDAMLAEAVAACPRGLVVRAFVTSKNAPLRQWLSRLGVDVGREDDGRAVAVPSVDWPAHVRRGQHDAERGSG